MMMYKSFVALLIVALASQAVHAQDRPTASKGPPPRFLTVKSTDQAKGEVIFDVQIVAQHVLDHPTVLVYPDGYQQLTLGTKPSYIHPAEGFKVPLKKARWSGTDGKEISAEAGVKRLKPGVMILLSADGAAVDEAYRRMFKEDTLVLTVAAEELLVPYIPHVGGALPVKKVEEH
jgi:hypothetical protein